ncbi:putative UDP-galactose--lipooligosaccharide galactosyltransferase [Moraxella macacae 0408225]|uniref:Putative UDP-galactose--lipooligosaccharide galactosyltransferase n=1 Tax=Moraxella macacae 0408225 TaxID=1230338 RepID=L2F5P6_9GAMM|nr:glycosyltransferase [Moraxella macacae]ELA08389.1 putative UDP-galactose--lipooligosaccharide galactosyltransferase [Moraxella macacae 0408225]
MKFSVLMSLYAKEQPNFLAECLLSLTKQILQADEIILVYDGQIGRDLQEVVDGFLPKLPLKIIQLPANVGLGKALNAGLEHCQFEWVFRMDTDDICVSERFAKQVDFIKTQPNIDVVGGQIIEFEQDFLQADCLQTDCLQTKNARVVPTSHDAIVTYAKSRNPINHMTVAFKKSAVQAVGGYQHAPLYEDYDLWVRLLSKNYRFANLPDVLVYARAGQAMYERRGGLAYAKNEMQMQVKFWQLGFVSVWQMIKNLAIRLPVRLLPNRLRSMIYQKLLRGC